MKQFTQGTTQLNKNQIINNNSKNFDKNGKHSTKHSQRNGLLKFMDNPNNNRANRNQGIRCLSNNTFGVSHDSPDCFKLTNTVVIDSPPKRIKNGGEEVKNPQTEPLKINFRTQQKFYPMKNYFHINDQNSQELSTQFVPDYINTVTQQQRPFNLVKSQYTGLIDSNILSQWKDQYPLMGFERSSEARKINNKDRSKLIQQKLKTRENFIRTFYQTRRLGENAENPHYPKQAFMNTYYSKNSRKSRSTSYIGGRNKNGQLFTFKGRIRASRIDLANKLHWQTHSYLVKDQHEANKTNMSTFYDSSHTSLSRPATSKPNLYKKKINLPQDIKKMDDIVIRHGDKNHKRAHSTLQQTNITEQKKQEMIQKIQHWSKRTHMHNLTQCSSFMKRIKNTTPKTTDI